MISPTSPYTYTPYNGSDDIMIVDGSSLPISHTGSISFTTTSQHDFQLNNAFCVPAMKKNLISVKQFCVTNNVSIESLPHFFLVKDFRTRAALPKLYRNIFKLSLSHDKTEKKKKKKKWEGRKLLVIGICVPTRLTFFDNWEKTATAKPSGGRWSNHHVMALINKERKKENDETLSTTHGNSTLAIHRVHLTFSHDVLLVAICSTTCHRKSLSPFLPPVMHARWRWLLLERVVYSFLNGLLFI